MRKCYYHEDPEVGSVLIPGCYGTAIYGITRCTCKRKPETFEQFEKREYREKLEEKEKYIKELESEVCSLNRIIRKLTKQKKDVNKRNSATHLQKRGNCA